MSNLIQVSLLSLTFTDSHWSGDRVFVRKGNCIEAKSHQEHLARKLSPSFLSIKTQILSLLLSSKEKLSSRSLFPREEILRRKTVMTRLCFCSHVETFECEQHKQENCSGIFSVKRYNRLFLECDTTTHC